MRMAPARGPSSRQLAGAEAWARSVGYKAGLTNPAVQKRFNTDRPVWGKLYEGMVLANGAAVPATFGARRCSRPTCWCGSRAPSINHARTPMDVLEAIDQVIPFIELPDLMVQAPPKLNGAGVAAINVGARLGVAGTPIAVPVTRGERYAMLDALRDMQVTLTDGSGYLLGGGKGSDVLEHPLNAVVWLAEALAQERKHHAQAGRSAEPGLVLAAVAAQARPAGDRPTTRA
jgi:2-keto-4-pentenoate hydratase